MHATPLAVRSVACLCAAVLVAGSITAQEPSRGLKVPVGVGGALEPLYSGGSYAILVGVSHYDPGTPWLSLDSIPAELDQLAGVLQEVGFEVVTRVENPTGNELRKEILEFMSAYGYLHETRLLFFFAGHGHTVDDRGYFVPRDAPDPSLNEPGFLSSALSMQQVATWASELKARHALFAFDSCFSGTIFRYRDSVAATTISVNTASKARQFISAGGPGEPVPAQSVFTPLFVSGLQGGADRDQDGFVTGTELGVFVQNEVMGRGTGQKPQTGKASDPNFDVGDMVFAVPAAYRAGGASTPLQESGLSARTVSIAANAGGQPRPASRVREDDSAIRQVIAQYKDAYARQDAEALRRIWPSGPDLTEVLPKMRSYRLELSDITIAIDPAGETARVTCKREARYQAAVGSAQTSSGQVTILMSREMGEWIISAVR